MALVSGSKVQQMDGPDVYGPNGKDYRNTDASVDLANIGIDIHEHGKGPRCKAGDWTTVHWVATLKDGRVVSDSRAEPGGLPKTFALGAHEVFSCWDLAITKLNEGDRVTLHCPSHYAWGTAFVNAPLGGERIPTGSDVDFDLQIVECSKTPEFSTYEAQPFTSTLHANKCFSMHLMEAEDQGRDLVMSAGLFEYYKNSQWWPTIYILLDDFVEDEEEQQFVMTPEGYIYNLKHGREWTLATTWGSLWLAKIGFRKSNWYPWSERTFFYDSESQQLTCEIPYNWYDRIKAESADMKMRSLAVGVYGSPRTNSWVYTGMTNYMFAYTKHHWRVQYCGKNN